MNKSRTKAARDTVPRTGGMRALKPSRVTVLHIDDDPNDTELFQVAARRANVEFSVQNVTDVEQAMAYLSGRGIYADRTVYPLPSLVLLDLKMPRATGFDMLRWIRKHPEAGHLPVVIFSGSELESDIQRAYAGGADSYFVKPIGFNALIDLVKNINASWLSGQGDPRSPMPVSAGGAQWQGSTSWFGIPGRVDGAGI
jgi:CheY-like chemotaxis protein